MAVMALALGAGGLVKGAAGMGLPIVALPILAAFLGVQHAVALISIPLIFTNAWQSWNFRAAREGDFLLPMMVGGAIGIAVGTWFIVSLPERFLSITLALIVFVYIALRLSNPHLAISHALGRRLAPGVGFCAGVLQGATGIASPIAATFIHAFRMARPAHVFSTSTVFLLFSVVQVPALAVAGVLTPQIALEGVFAIVPALAMMPLGNWLAHRVSQAAFDRFVLVLLGVVAMQLLWKSLAPLI
jgi:hypothetical protein